MGNHDLKRSFIKLGFSLLIVSYNSAQNTVNLLVFIEEVVDFDKNSSREIS